MKYKTTKSLWLIFFILPAFLVFNIFIIYPMAGSLIYSLYEWRGLTIEKFNGFGNFIKLFSQYPHNIMFVNAFKHNVLFFILTMFIQNTFGLFLAVVLSKNLRGTTFYRSIFFVPVVLSIIVVGFLWELILNPVWGAANKLLVFFSLRNFVRSWLGDPTTALPTIILVNAWHWVGFPTIVFLAGIQGVPEQYLEAARLDGASEFRVFRYITLPLIAPAITIITLLTFIGSFNVFDIIYVMEGLSGGPYHSTDVLGTLFYRTAFGEIDTGIPDFGLGFAISVTMFVIVFTFSIVGYILLRRREIEY